jgi:hypothetical protein
MRSERPMNAIPQNFADLDPQQPEVLLAEPVRG